jgi:hypothetical protein
MEMRAKKELLGGEKANANAISFFKNVAQPPNTFHLAENVIPQ